MKIKNVIRKREDGDERREVIADEEFQNFKYVYSKEGKVIEMQEFTDMWDAIHKWESEIDIMMEPYKGSHSVTKNIS